MSVGDGFFVKTTFVFCVEPGFEKNPWKELEFFPLGNGGCGRSIS